MVQSRLHLSRNSLAVFLCAHYGVTNVCELTVVAVTISSRAELIPSVMKDFSYYDKIGFAVVSLQNAYHFIHLLYMERT